MERIAIIGAGAAGCFAAANIPAAEGREVVVFEKTGKDLQKVKVSGGGRCNLTHHCFEVPELVQKYPRGKSLLRKSLHHFTPADTIRWFEQRGLKVKAEEDGRMFPATDESQSVIDCIRRQMAQNGAEVQYHKHLVHVDRQAGAFILHFADKSVYTADKLIIATGGYPKAEQYQWLASLGHELIKPVPSLFTFNIPGHPIVGLMGVSVPFATVKIQGTKIQEQGPVLITHWGLSGPAILRTSAWGARELEAVGYHFTAVLNWLGETTENDLKAQFLQMRQEQGSRTLMSRNPFDLPRRLWEFFLERCGIHDQVRWGELPQVQQRKLMEMLLRDTFPVSGKTTFKEEFVTCGGIALNAIQSQTMESRLIPGLYFAGEVMDVDGITGGFNFQHAWSSAYLAARHILDGGAEKKAALN